jgi:hypothetical protein
MGTVRRLGTAMIPASRRGYRRALALRVHGVAGVRVRWGPEGVSRWSANAGSRPVRLENRSAALLDAGTRPVAVQARLAAAAAVQR